MEELDYTKHQVNNLWEMADELFAREISSNSVYKEWGKYSWEQLLNQIILTACTLKQSIPTDIEIVHDGEHYSYNDSIEDAIDDLIFIDGLLR